jgi:hypothetical protein
MQEAGLLDGSGEVEEEVMRALINSLRESSAAAAAAAANKDEISSVSNPIGSDDSEQNQKNGGGGGGRSSTYACPECSESFDNWDSCLSHFAITSHADYNDDTDKEVLKKQCIKETASLTTYQIADAVPANSSTSSYSQPAISSPVSFEAEVVSNKNDNKAAAIAQEEEANIGDID